MKDKSEEFFMMVDGKPEDWMLHEQLLSLPEEVERAQCERAVLRAMENQGISRGFAEILYGYRDADGLFERRNEKADKPDPTAEK